MRVFLLTAVAAALSVAACMGGGDEATLQRNQQDVLPSRSQKPTTDSNGSDDSTTSTTPPASPASDAAAPSTSEAGTTPDASPGDGTCGAPKCFGYAGFGGCKATNTAGESVVLACDGGGCACLTAGETTSTFEGEVTSGEDAKQLFLTNCACL